MKITREIKFKARNKQSGEWKTFTLDNICDGHMTERYMWEDWREFTGLKDKNGVEIYEGDIVKVLSTPPFLAVVEFKDGAFFPVSSKKVREEAGFEVIGNIYENEELLQ